MIYSILLHLIAFLATKHIVAKDLAFFSPLNGPARGTYGIREGLDSENHFLLEGQVEAKDYDTDIREVMSLHTQYESQDGKNEQEIRSEQGWHW